MNRTKDAIYKSAIDMFSTKGYNGTTVHDIALNAGITKGTLYYHFKSKEDIFNYMVKKRIINIEEAVEETVEKIEDPILKIENLCRTQLRLIYENRSFFKLVINEVSARQLRIIEFDAILKKYVKKIEEYLKEAKNRGIINQCNVSFLSYGLLGALTFTSIYEIVNDERIDLEETTNNLIKYVFGGIMSK